MSVWTRVQAASFGTLSGGGSASSVSATFGSPVTAGNLIIAVPSQYNSTFTSVSDSINLTNYTSLTSSTAFANRIALYYYVAATGGSGFDVTAHFGTGCYPSLCIAEYSCGGGTISVSGTATNGSGTSATPSIGAITVGSGALVVAGMATSAAGQTYGAGSGFTLGNVIQYTPAECIADVEEYILNQAAGSVTPAFTIGASQSYTMVAGAFTFTGGSTFALLTRMCMDGLSGFAFGDPLAG